MLMFLMVVVAVLFVVALGCVVGALSILVADWVRGGQAHER